MESADIVRRLGFAHKRIFANFPPYRIACVIGPLALLTTMLGLWIPRPAGSTGSGPPSAPTVSAADQQICGSNDDASEIIAACQRLIKAGGLSPRDVGQAYYHIGEMEFGEDDLGAAINDFNSSLSYFPDDGIALDARSAAEEDNNEVQAAIKDANAALALNPKDAIAFQDLGWAYDEGNDYDNAVNDETKSIDILPNNAFAYWVRADSSYNLKKYQSAIQDDSTAININPSYESAYEARGSAEYRLNQNTKAESDEQTALRMNPNDTDAKQILQWAEAALPVAAEPSPAAAPPAAPPGGNPVSMGEELMCGSDDDNDAQIAACNQMLEGTLTAAQRGNTYFNLGHAELFEGHYSTSATALTTALVWAPNNAETYEDRGIDEYELHEYAVAKKDEQAALRLDPGDGAATQMLQEIVAVPSQ
jgi:tetratricopeptide (TPR) repeat protein